MPNPSGRELSMRALSDDEKQTIVKALEARGAKLPCPRCANPTFFLLDGYFFNPLVTDLKALTLGGPAVPTVVVACGRCGYLSQHALGALGLMPPAAEGSSGSAAESKSEAPAEAKSESSND